MKTPRPATTQDEAVLRHLRRYGKITSMAAINRYGATRLSAIIWRLRKAGANIETTYANTTNRYGHKTTYAVYIYHRSKRRNTKK